MKLFSKNVFFLVIILLCITLLNAQAPDTLWTRTYGGPDPFDEDVGYSVQQTSDSGYIIAGYTESFDIDYGDVWLVKTNANGDTLWTGNYGGDRRDEGRSVQQTYDKGYIIAGWTLSSGAGHYDVFLVKTDSIGNRIWTKTYGWLDTDGGNSVIQTSDSGYVVAGRYNPYDFGNMDVYLIKTKENGDTLWTRRYGGLWSDEGNSVQQTTDTGYIIAGFTNSHTAGANIDVYLIKTDENGDTVWSKTYGGAQSDRGYSVQQTFDNGYIIAGKTNSFGGGSCDIYLIKTDTIGDTIWTKAYGGADEEEGWSVQQTSDSGYVVAGYTQSYGAGYADIYLIKTDVNGDTLWTKTFGGEWSDKGYAVQCTSDNGYAITGYTYNFSGGFDVYLVKTQPDQTGCDEKEFSQNIFTGLQINPNPFSKKTDIRFQILNNSNHEIKIYDVSGRLVKHFSRFKPNALRSRHISWEGTDNTSRKLPSGVYFVKFKVENYSETKKLLLIR